MRPRRIIAILGGVVLLFIGGAAVWFAMSIPNDVRAEALLKAARTSLENDQRDKARDALESIVRDYPRTDAAATATQTLFRMADQDRRKAEEQIAVVLKSQKEAVARIGALEKKIAELTTRPTPVISKPPVPKTTVKRKAPVPKRTTSTRRRRRR